MKNIFEHTRSSWVKYSEYDFVQDEDSGQVYIMPASDAKPQFFNPLENAEQMVIDALNVGLTCMSEESTDEDKETGVFSFVSEYGLLGLMTALPTTPQFMDYDAVYLTKNQYIKAETMSTEDYLNIFFPFEMPDIIKNKNGTMWSIEGDRDMMALAMTMDSRPMAVNMEFQREYAERYDWLVKQFKDWAFIFFTTTMYYDNLDNDNKDLYRQAMACFDGIAPTYHIELLDKPTLVWDFHSLLLGIQMMFSFILVNGQNPLRICKHCGTIFKASRPSAVFCSPQCKNRYNVYKSRSKHKG
ncbi:MAG: hypothetical protein IJH36_11395 [Clostridia bacterium]|nr:hypothetical protein [Clostridia bacterium]MBQ3463686.1 hypothetical protein [Clostridia bacterium]